MLSDRYQSNCSAEEKNTSTAEACFRLTHPSDLQEADTCRVVNRPHEGATAKVFLDS